MKMVLVSEVVIGDRCRKDLGDIEALARSIVEVGLLHPIVLTPDYELVAGERRLEAYNHLGLAEIEATVVDNLADALALAQAQQDENTCRKDFAPSEMVAMGKRLEVVEKPKAEAREKAGVRHEPSGNLPQGATGETREKVAQAVGVSGRTYDKAKAVVEAAEEDPDTFGHLPKRMDKTDKVDPAYKELRRIQKQQEDERKAETVPDVAECYQLHCADIGQLGLLEPESVDVIITDPPYGEKHLHLWDELGRLAAHALKPGGSLVAMSGQRYLIQALVMLEEHLDYHWTLAYLTPGGRSPIAPSATWQVNSFWKPVLWFTKGEYGGQHIGDVVRSETSDKTHHTWGQSISGTVDLVERFSAPGDTVLDPFVGGGSTAVAALHLKRRFIGIDIDAQAIATTKARIAEIEEGDVAHEWARADGVA